jgi:hypothetical protein
MIERDDVLIVDALLHRVAEQTAAIKNISIEDALEETWELFERGFLRLVGGDGDCPLGFEPTSRTERRDAAKRNKQSIQARRRPRSPLPHTNRGLSP